MYYFIELHTKSYNTHDTELFPSTKLLTGIELQHRGKLFLLPLSILSQ